MMIAYTNINSGKTRKRSLPTLIQQHWISSDPSVLLGEKYTKILEQLAVLYMQSAGDVLHKSVTNTGTGSIPSTDTSPSGSSTKELENRLNKLEEATNST